MAKLRDKIKTALDESRMLILGAQIFVGFPYRAVFEKEFQYLPLSSRYLRIAALLVLLIGVGLLIAPGSYHRIVRSGSDAADVHRFATGVMDLALIPFMLTLGMDFYVVTGRFLGTTGGIMEGVATSAAAFIFWYGIGFFSRPRRKRSDQGRKPDELPRAHPTELRDKVDQVLTEARVVLPGAQALLGFQLITMLMEGFDKLPQSSKYIHVFSLSLMAVTIILLMTPAAFHRIVERGEDTELVTASAREHIASSLADGGLSHLLSEMTTENQAKRIRNGYQYFVALESDTLVGTAAIRLPSHLYY